MGCLLSCFQDSDYVSYQKFIHNDNDNDNEKYYSSEEEYFSDDYFEIVYRRRFNSND